MKEIWKDVLGYEGLYQASNLGNVRSLNYRMQGIVKNLNIYKSKSGYTTLGLSKDCIRKSFNTHIVIMHAFYGPPGKGLEVNHKNGIKDDNRLENLEYCTRSENLIHKYRVLKTEHHMQGRKGKDNPNSIKIKQYTKSGEFIKEWDSITQAVEFYNIGRSNISRCCKGYKGFKTCHGYKWEYSESEYIEEYCLQNKF